jgi:hypothetical protein
MRLKAEVILTHSQRRLCRVEKQKPNWSGYREKPHMRPRHPTNLKLKTQKNHLCHVRNFFIFFAPLGHPLPAAASRLSERPLSKADIQ